MKKYQQLLLAILSVVSFSCLLIYRHEYNKLRYVLEVLNFFGSPGAVTVAPVPCSNNSIVEKLAAPQMGPLPAWQRISNSLFIYSAYWEKVNDKEHVVALAVGVLSENLNYGCYLYYDTAPKSNVGQFSFVAFYPSKNPYTVNNKNFGKSRTKGFLFYCEAKNIKSAPVGVVFYKTTANETFEGFLPVFNLQSNQLLANSVAICILPSQFSSVNRSTYLEFLSFHKILGINNFVVYGGNEQYNLLSSIHQNPDNQVSLSIMQWNFPFFGDYELEKVLAENDCKLRTVGSFENVLVLEWNKFFVPRHPFSVSKILNELDSSKKTFKFQFSTLLFCNEYEDNVKFNKSMPNILKKTKYAFPKTDILVPIYRPHLKTGPVQKVNKDTVAVQQYASCRNFKIKSGQKKVAKTDSSIYKYENELLNSQLLKLYT